MSMMMDAADVLGFGQPSWLLGYLDPGAGSVLLTMIAAMVGSLIMFGRTVLGWVVAPFSWMFRRNRPARDRGDPTRSRDV